MLLLKIILLGIIQGATEFLPVSSSGHLLLAEMLMGAGEKTDLFTEIMLHLGTLVAVSIYSRREIVMVVRAFFRIGRPAVTDGQKEDRRLLIALLLATAATFALAVVLRQIPAAVFANYYFLAATFAVTAIILAFSSRLSPGDKPLGTRTALVVGLVQGLAVLPGISRAGSTIVAGQAMGLNRKASARFAFFLSIPAIAGASLVTVLEMADSSKFNTDLMLPLICGMMAAAFVGYLSLIVLTRIIEKARLQYFAFYVAAVSLFCVVMGIVS